MMPMMSFLELIDDVTGQTANHEKPKGLNDADDAHRDVHRLVHTQETNVRLTCRHMNRFEKLRGAGGTTTSQCSSKSDVLVPST